MKRFLFIVSEAKRHKAILYWNNHYNCFLFIDRQYYEENKKDFVADTMYRDFAIYREPVLIEEQKQELIKPKKSIWKAVNKVMRKSKIKRRELGYTLINDLCTHKAIKSFDKEREWVECEYCGIKLN